MKTTFEAADPRPDVLSGELRDEIVRSTPDDRIRRFVERRPGSVPITFPIHRVSRVLESDLRLGVPPASARSRTFSAHGTTRGV